MITYKILQLSDGSNEPRVIMTNIHNQDEGYRVVNLLNNDAAEAYGIRFILETDNENFIPADKLPFEKPAIAIVGVTCPLCNGFSRKLPLTNLADCVEPSF